MDPLSKRLSLVRYAAVLVAMCVVVFGYRIATNGLKAGTLAAPIFFAIICLKYLLFDALARMARRRWPRLKVLPWLWIGYGMAACTDVVVTWMTISDEGGASFALAMTVLLSPWFLAGALVLMILHTLSLRRQKAGH